MKLCRALMIAAVLLTGYTFLVLAMMVVGRDRIGAWPCGSGSEGRLYPPTAFGTARWG